MNDDDAATVRRVLLAAAAFVFALALFGLSRSAAAAPPSSCRWRVVREKVTVAGGATAAVGVPGSAEPFAAAYLGPTAGGEQWAVLTRTCER